MPYLLVSRFFGLFLGFYLFFTQTSFSQEIVDLDSTIMPANNKHAVGFPAILYSPELTWAFGGAGTYYFKHKDSLVRTSFVQVLGIVTLRKQLVLGFESSFFSPNEKSILRIHGSVSRFPDRFWGLGNNSRREDREQYAISQYYLFPQLLRNVYKKFYVGIAYETQNVFSFEYYNKPNGDPSIFDVQQVAGRKGSLTSGIGIVLLWDNRNNAFSSSRGFYFEYYVNRFSSAFGSGYNYLSQVLDARKFLYLSKTSVMAFQFLGNFNQGDVPVRSMANMGSGSIMRGYYEGRYTDNHMLAFQVELRQHLISRFGMVAFAGVGRVANRLSEFAFNGLKPSFGTGLRLALDRDEKLNIRVDVGFGNHSQGVYLNLSEAF